MTKIINYVTKEAGEKGGITISDYSGEKVYTAVGLATSKNFKTLKGAEKWLAERDFIKV